MSVCPSTASATGSHLDFFDAGENLVVSIPLTPEQSAAIKAAIPNYSVGGEWPLTVFFGEHTL